MRKIPLIRNAACRIMCLLLPCLLVACRNPFFPPSGSPPSTSSVFSRATPMGVIRQLVRAYESRDIFLFEDLLPKERTFQFYVAPAFQNDYQNKPYARPVEPRDPRVQFITQEASYYYWTHELEVQSHKNLFAKAQSIQFTVPPNVNPGDFRYTVNDDGDTTNVEILMTDGEIHVTIEPDVRELDVFIDKQVFFLERDASNQWVIRKWYDLSRQ